MRRFRDRRAAGEQEKFSSKLLPPYLRKAKSVEELIPYLYLKGVSTGDFTDYDLVVAALGGHGEHVTRPEDIRPALDRAFAAGKPALVTVDDHVHLVQVPVAGLEESAEHAGPGLRQFLQ